MINKRRVFDFLMLPTDIWLWILAMVFGYGVEMTIWCDDDGDDEPNG